jgi:hypothetical protein
MNRYPNGKLEDAVEKKQFFSFISMKNRTILILLLFIIGFFETFPLGFLGIMPVDQSMVFEAGGRIANGEILFKDFYISHGLVPSYIQALLFKIFGLKWWVYVLHASVFNGLFVILAFKILDYFHPGKRGWNIFISILSGWLFYPIVGTPYPENHSFFFGLLSIFAILQLFKGKTIWLYFVFPCLLLSYLSKPIPAMFFVLPIVIIFFYHPELITRKSFFKLITGFVFGLLVFFMIPLTTNANSFLYYYISLPMSKGYGRILQGFFLQAFKKVVKGLPLSIAFAGALSIVHFCVNLKNWRDKINGLVFFSLGLVAVGLIFSLLTFNQIQNSFGILFIGFGLLIPALIDYYGYSLKMDKKNIFLISILLMTLGLDCARSVSYNLKRSYNDMTFSFSGLKNYSKDLGFFFQAPIDPQINFQIDFSDVNQLIKFLKKEHQPFCYFGDLTILNPILKNRSPFPLVTFEYGLTLPNKGTEEFSRFRENLQKSIIKYNEKYLIIENEVTWMGVNVYDFFDQQDIQNMPKQYFGKITVVTLNR